MNPPDVTTSARVTFGISLYTGQSARGVVGPHYRDAVSLARDAEAAGFDMFWVSEHHGLDDGYLPAPLVLLGALATATSTIGLGAGVVIGPLCHPVRLAEEAVVVDNLSDGRLVLGLGAGYLPSEFAMFGVDPSRRGALLDEIVQILRLCWRGEPFTWHGDAFTLEGTRVTPAPIRRGGIPIWLGGYATGALRRAGRLADGHLVGRGDPDIVEASATAIRAAMGDNPRPFTFGLNVTIVLTDPGGHPRSALAGFAAQQLTYERLQAGTDVYAGRVESGHPNAATLAHGPIESYVHLHGSASEIVDGLAAVLDGLGDWPHVHVALRALFPEFDVGVQRERIDRLGADVLAPLRRHPAFLGSVPTTETRYSCSDTLS